MSRYIDAEPYRKKLIREINKSGKYTSYECGLDDACTYLYDTPTADVEEVRHGKWIKKNNVNYSPFDGSPEYIYICSECGREENKQEPYCNCGATMDGGNRR